MNEQKNGFRVLGKINLGRYSLHGQYAHFCKITFTCQLCSQKPLIFKPKLRWGVHRCPRFREQKRLVLQEKTKTTSTFFAHTGVSNLRHSRKSSLFPAIFATGNHEFSCWGGARVALFVFCNNFIRPRFASRHARQKSVCADSETAFPKKKVFISFFSYRIGAEKPPAGT